MRVARPDDSERGAIAVIIAVCLVMLMGCGAIAVDAGQLWANRRNMVTVTDAAALAAAQTYARGSNGCSTAAGTYADSNLASAEITGCGTTSAGVGGTVTVAARNEADLLFAKVWGESTRTVHSSTTARWGYPSGVSGLRPFAVCTAAPAFAAWTDKTQPYGPVVITYGKSQVNACGVGTPGNWGVIDFNGGSNSNSETDAWVANGYPGEVTAPGNYPGNTGVFPSNSLNLAQLVSKTFTIPLFDSVTGNGSGASFHLVGFASVTLNAVHDSGTQANRSLTLTFKPGVVQGTCCGTPVIDTGIRVVDICAVDPTTSCS